MLLADLSVMVLMADMPIASVAPSGAGMDLGPLPAKAYETDSGPAP